ncbi:MAG TPA: hypothetical protein VGH75_02340 [Steroidobacteraceae bacterium]
MNSAAPAARKPAGGGRAELQLIGGAPLENAHEVAVSRNHGHRQEHRTEQSGFRAQRARRCAHESRSEQLADEVEGREEDEHQHELHWHRAERGGEAGRSPW